MLPDFNLLNEAMSWLLKEWCIIN